MCNLMTISAPATSGDPTPTGITVRPAGVPDAPAVAAIHNQYVGGGPHTMEATPWYWHDVKHDLETHHAREATIVAEDVAGNVIGYGKVKRYSDREGYRIACETSVYVDRDARGHGVGDAIVGRLVRVAEQLGYRHITAKIIAGNGASVRLHFKHGFELVGIQRGIGIVDDRPADVAILQAQLNG